MEVKASRHSAKKAEPTRFCAPDVSSPTCGQWQAAGSGIHGDRGLASEYRIIQRMAVQQEASRLAQHVGMGAICAIICACCCTSPQVASQPADDAQLALQALLLAGNKPAHRLHHHTLQQHQLACCQCVQKALSLCMRRSSDSASAHCLSADAIRSAGKAVIWLCSRCHASP